MAASFRLLAHRGLRSAGAENSLRSVVAAFGPSDGAEVDVIVDAEGVALLRHDERLPDGTPVRALRLEELRSRLGANVNDVPRLRDVFDALDGREGTLNLELKVPGAARAVAAVRPLPRGVVFTSFYASEVMEARACFPGVPSGLLATRVPRFVPPGVACLSVQHRALAPVREAYPAAALWAWTVDDAEALARARAARCDVVISDDPSALRRKAVSSPTPFEA